MLPPPEAHRGDKSGVKLGDGERRLRACEAEGKGGGGGGGTWPIVLEDELVFILRRCTCLPWPRILHTASLSARPRL